jgi:transposase-like protein
MEEPGQKRTRIDREEWAKRVERWRDSGLTTAEFAGELGINPRTLTYWAWALKREASEGKREWSARKSPAPTRAAASVARSGFVEVASAVPLGRFELEVRGRRLHIPSAFDAEQLRALLEILETA